MPLIRGISRGLWRTLSSQGGQLPLEAEVKTPIQAVQIVDNVSHTIAPVTVPNGFFLINHGLAPPALSSAGFEVIAGDGGIWLYFDPALVIVTWSDANRPAGIVGGGIFTAINMPNYGVPETSQIAVIDVVTLNLIGLPELTAPALMVPDWFYIPPGHRAGFATTPGSGSVAYTQTVQFREALGS